jgi:glyoxylase I family protein
VTATGTSTTVLRAVDHIGMVVPDIDRAVAFLVEGIGATEIYRHGPYPVMPMGGRAADTTIVAIAMLRWGSTNFELMQYEASDQRTLLPRLGDLGSFHIALYAGDLEESVARLQDAGASVTLAPRDLIGLESGPGARFAYLLSPWGQPIELITYPEGREYESTTERRLHDPRNAGNDQSHGGA